MDTPMDFSNFLMNRLKVDTLTLELLAGLTYEQMKGSCKSLVELEFLLEEVYKAMTDHLNWVNLEGRFNFRRTSLTGFPAQSIRSSNAIALGLPYLLVLIIETSQSRQHDKSESDSYYLSD
nr:hypothetical protein [Tanacetum cinerariifolium]